MNDQEASEARIQWKKRGFRMSRFAGGPVETVTRQQRRADCRKSAWHKWRCFAGPEGPIDQAPRDDHGVIARRIRRSIANAVAKQAFKIMGKPGANVQRG